MNAKLFLVVCLSICLAACSTSRYSMRHDKAPTGDFDASGVPDAIPVWEPLSPQGNRSPYTVRGKQYRILPSAAGYREEGIASWYGLKFHGELTSNGEIYNMYAMSAAHKSLPLPTYVKVTNLSNQRSVIVRVNDRGPFHSERVIDLSYAAAKKLGFDKQGTARVLLEAIVPGGDASVGDSVGQV
ncbi:MAG: septal ring lytic transglycosylase RlpA family protein, partial [Oleiphilaceae bacterium]|nr:septal ring lytic transglycosylase RlpA family protein [Oleiphilaceae bacterium]